MVVLLKSTDKVRSNLLEPDSAASAEVMNVLGDGVRKYVKGSTYVYVLQLFVDFKVAFHNKLWGSFSSL